MNLNEVVSHYGLKGKTCAIELPHDVDKPEKCPILKMLLFINSKTITWNIHNNLAKIREKEDFIIDKDRNNYWLFNYIMQAENRYSLKSAFFFASMNLYGEYGSPYDVTYNIQNRKFSSIFDEILK